MIGYDEEEGTYVRFPVELDDGVFETVIDVTETVQNEGRDTSYDWTEVVLFGESDDHDTVAEPLGKGKPQDRSFIATQIFRRFASFGDGVEVRIDVAMTKGGGKDETGRTRQLKTLEDVLDKLPQHQRVYCPDGEICVHYIHDPKTSHTLSAIGNPATASTTFCALVHKGERYDFKTKKSWSSVAPNFGIPFGSKVLTIEIEIPDYMALPNQYRDGLTWPEDRSELSAEDFADYVRELMPNWVKDVIREQSPKTEDDLDDIQSDLQKLLDEFRVPTVTFASTSKPNAIRTDTSSEGTDASDPSESDADFEDAERQIRDERGSDRRKSHRAKDRKIRKAPDGAKRSRSAKALERVPQIKILTTPEEVAEKELKGRAGRYYKDTQLLFINGLYPSVDRMAAELEPELRSLGEPEIVRAAIRNTCQRFMAFRVGKATCFAISKRLADDWTSDDLDRATSPESLSLAADDYRQSLSPAKRWAKQRIKLTDVPEDAAA